MTTTTSIPAIGGGYMIRGAGGRFVGVLREALATAIRIRDGRVYRVTTLPDAPKPRWACKARPVGKSQHGKRGGARANEPGLWAFRAARMAAAA